MEVTRIADGAPYAPPGHTDCVGIRIQGGDVTATESFSVGLSHYLPGGRAEMEPGPIEKVYVVIEGEVTVSGGDGEVTLRRLDSCRLAPGEAPVITNRTNVPASMIVVLPVAPKPEH